MLDLLSDLVDAGVLIVFNHPLWDLAAVGEDAHAVSLREFLDGYQSKLHAIISGGDRHGSVIHSDVRVTSIAV